MSQNVLWLHHFHAYWESGLESFETTFNKEMNKVMDYIKHEDIDRVVITMFEEDELQPEHNVLEKYCRENGIIIDSYEYNYAWSKECDRDGDIYSDDNFEDTWIYGTRDYHSENDVIEIENWQKEFKENDDKVILAGAFANECLKDAYSVLEHLEVDFEENQSLCVGYYVDYKFQGDSPSSIFEYYVEKINEIEVKIQIFTMQNDCDDDFESVMNADRDFLKEISNELNDLFSDDEHFEVFLENDFWFSSSYDYIEDQLDDILSNHVTSTELLDRIEEWEEENPLKKNKNRVKVKI